MADDTNKGSEDDFDFEVNIEPDASALRMFRSMSFTPWYALGEFVDNSITSALKNIVELKKKNGPDYELEVSISFPENENMLVIEDNAAGITKKEMKRALKTGVPPADTSVGLGKHGVGMKAASLWWGAHIIIDTYPLGEKNGWHVEIDASDGGDVTANVKVKRINHRGYAGTRLEVRELWKKTPQTKTITSIKSYLPSIYRSFLGETRKSDDLKCVLLYQGKPLKFEYPKLLDEPLWTSKSGPGKGEISRLWRKEVDVTLSTGKKISGWVGILEQMSRDLSGFFLHYRGKGIAGVVPLNGDSDEDQAEAKDAISRGSYKPRKIFKQQGSYPDQSFIGEFDITEFGKTITTDSPLWTPDEEGEFTQKLFDLMTADNFIKMAINYRRRKAASMDEKANKSADKEEAKIIQGALDGKVDHQTLEAEELDLENIRSILGSEIIEDLMTINLRDKEDHPHEFRISFIKDVSRQFLIVTEDENYNHLIQINVFHPSLNDINIDVNGRKILQRICVAFAASEVFNSGYDKAKIRTKANQILSQLGQIIED
jgi:Histidine kinase-, DNA gyrase B-, and HSP90-like ATPase